MKVISTFYKPSAICCSERCRLTPNNEYLVVGKPDRIEVHSLQSEGLRYECSIEVWGQVVAVKPVYFPDAKMDKVLLLTDHPYPKLVLLSLSISAAGDSSLTEDCTVDLLEAGAQPSEFLTDIVVDISATAVVAVCYARKIKVVLLENQMFGDNFDVSVPEQCILSVAFIPTPSATLTLGILHLDNEQRPYLTSRDLDLTERELSPPPSIYFPGSALPQAAIPISENLPILISVHHPDLTEPFFGGLVVLGGKEIHFFAVTQTKQKAKSKDVETRSSSDTGQTSSAKGQGQNKETKRRKAKSSVTWPWNEVSAWCDIGHQKYLLADKAGWLVLLELDPIFGFTIMPLGQTNRAVSLTYLSSQVIYLGSFLNDSQLLKVHPAPFKTVQLPDLPLSTNIKVLSPSDFDVERRKRKHTSTGRVVSGPGCYVEVLETYPNLTPISDAILYDSNCAGQPQIVTCSGGGNSGSLKIVSNSATFLESAVVPLKDVTSIFPLRASYNDNFHTHVVVSTPRETHLFRFDSNSVSHVEGSTVTGLATNLPTLTMSNIAKRIPKSTGKATSTYVDSSLVVQVTINEVLLIDVGQALGIPVLIGEPWNPKTVNGWQGKHIVVAAINASQIILALSGGILVLLNLDESDRFHLSTYKDFGCDISAVSCLPSRPSMFYSTTVVVGFWESNSVHILSLSDPKIPFQLVCMTSSLPALPRSVLLHNFGSSKDAKPHLLVGLTDGTLVSYVYDEVGKVLSAKTTTALGNSAVNLAVFNVAEHSSVFACASRAEILYWDKQTLQRSPVLLKDTICATRLNTARFPSCLVLSTRERIIIGSVRGLKQVHIRSVPYGSDIPQRILSIPKLKAFGVAFTQELIDHGLKASGKFRLLDQISFGCLAEFACEPGEEISALELITTSRDGTYVCLGTVYIMDAETEPSKGRLVFLKVHDGSSLSTMQISQVFTIVVQGCVYALANLGETLAVAVNSSVILFVVSDLESGLRVERTTSWDHNYMVTSLVSNGNTLIVGDVIHSISLLDINNGAISIRARDHTPLWPFRINSLDDHGIIGSNVDRNLFTFRCQTSDNRTVLERDGSYNLHELTTKFIPGSLSQADGNAVLTPKQVFFTSTGRVGIISELDPKLALDMTAFQSNMEKVVIGLGGTKHDVLRAQRGRYESHPSLGFLDGQFLEQFLHLKLSARRQIMTGSNEAERLKLTEAQIDQVLEWFQRIH